MNTITTNNLIIIIIIFIFIYCLYSNYYLDDSNNNNNNSQENYDNYQKITSKYYDFVVFDGDKYILYKPKKPFIDKTNPLIFKKKEELVKYLFENNYNSDLQVIDVRSNKNNNDPTRNYEYNCVRQNKIKIDDIVDCMDKINRNFQKEEINKLKNNNVLTKLENLPKLERKDIDFCMLKKVKQDQDYLGNIPKNNYNEIKYMNELF